MMKNFQKCNLLLPQISTSLEPLKNLNFKLDNSEGGPKWIYYGETKEGTNLMEGRGTICFVDGQMYSGEFKSDREHGKGRQYLTSGDWYEGRFANNKRSGTGTYIWANGKKWTGKWKGIKRQGIGIFEDLNGDLLKETYDVDGKLVERINILIDL